MESNVIESALTDVLDETLTAADDELYLVNPTTATIEELVGVLDADTPTVRLLAPESTLKDVMDDFLVAGAAADHVEAGNLELRAAEGDTNTLVITDSAVVALVTADEHAAGLSADDEAFVSGAAARFEEAWEGAEPFDLRTPALSRVRHSLKEDLGEPTAEDFDSVLDSLETARGNGDGLDEVTISILVAARNEDLLYDISKWGEDVGIASKATFSRTKSRLEEMGLIDTEKVPIDVGRPRLRLKLGDERLDDASNSELANVAQSMLAA
jgi:predicted transcriptional regulator